MIPRWNSVNGGPPQVLARGEIDMGRDEPAGGGVQQEAGGSAVAGGVACRDAVSQLSGAFDRPIDRLGRVLGHTGPVSPAGLSALARTHRDQAEFASADFRQAFDYSAQSGSVAGLEVGRVDIGQRGRFDLPDQGLYAAPEGRARAGPGWATSPRPGRSRNGRSRGSSGRLLQPRLRSRPGPLCRGASPRWG